MLQLKNKKNYNMMNNQYLIKTKCNFLFLKKKINNFKIIKNLKLLKFKIKYKYLKKKIK